MSIRSGGVNGRLEAKDSPLARKPCQKPAIVLKRVHNGRMLQWRENLLHDESSSPKPRESVIDDAIHCMLPPLKPTPENTPIRLNDKSETLQSQ
jgi:hypothetical protein